MLQRIFSLLITLTLSASIYADNFTGSVFLKHQKFNDLTTNGSLEFSDLTITGKFVSHGSVIGTKLTCNHFSNSGSLQVKDFKASHGIVEGALYGEHIVVLENLKISGECDVSKSKFGTIEINSDTATFEDSEIANIIVKFANKSQKIILKGKTIVAGNIIFESGYGKIYLSSKTKIIGKVKGAELIKQ